PGGPEIKFDWIFPGLTVDNYEIYRYAPISDEMTFLTETTANSFTEKLEETFPDYSSEDKIIYLVKANLTSGGVATSSVEVSIPECAPYLKSIETLCVTTPEFHLSWTPTKGSSFYEIWREGVCIASTTGATTYVDSPPCPGNICTFKYKIKAIPSGKESNEVEKNIDCSGTCPSPP
ncbi:MAG: hypothetical protein QME68_07455, partial [Elusimicrobiota bacterium]|nr:hypothetical protein [Elusimicrobiota bacterium]